MDCLNKIEICGIIGAIRRIETDGAKGAVFSVATNYAYKDKNGDPVIETTWHQVTAFAGRDIKEETLCALEKRGKVHVVGRLRNTRYVGLDGIERGAPEIVARSVETV